MKFILSSFLMLCISFSVQAFEQLIEIDENTDVSVETYSAEGDKLILWIPSEYGLLPRYATTATSLSQLGIEVWIPDLHAAWFIPSGRFSLNKVKPQQIIPILEKALQSKKQVYFFGSGRSASLILQTVRRYQLSGKETAKLAGLIVINPNLSIKTPRDGEEAELLPIATASNLPIYILQPQQSTRYWHTPKIVTGLSLGGSPVFTHILKDVGDGFHIRPEFSDTEDKLTKALPSIIKQATHQLAPYSGTPATAAEMLGEETRPQASTDTALLKPYSGKNSPPKLKLEDLDGNIIDLASLKGKVVMINFWATWCPPCVEEIPSLQKLYASRKADGLELLAIDVGEDRQQVRDFISKMDISFPILLDTDGQALKGWGIHAFPTTLILDRQHRIRYAAFGALDWDEEEIHQTLNTLLK